MFSNRILHNDGTAIKSDDWNVTKFTLNFKYWKNLF